MIQHLVNDIQIAAGVVEDRKVNEVVAVTRYQVIVDRFEWTTVGLHCAGEKGLFDGRFVVDNIVHREHSSRQGIDLRQNLIDERRHRAAVAGERFRFLG